MLEISTWMWFPQPWFCIYIYTCICNIRFRCFPVQLAFILPKYICTYMYTNVRFWSLDKFQFTMIWLSGVWKLLLKAPEYLKKYKYFTRFPKHNFTTYLLKWIEVTLFNRFTLLSLRFYRSTSILQYSNSTLLQNTEIIFPT